MKSMIKMKKIRRFLAFMMTAVLLAGIPVASYAEELSAETGSGDVFEDPGIFFEDVSVAEEEVSEEAAAPEEAAPAAEDGAEAEAGMPAEEDASEAEAPENGDATEEAAVSDDDSAADGGISAEETVAEEDDSDAPDVLSEDDIVSEGALTGEETSDVLDELTEISEEADGILLEEEILSEEVTESISEEALGEAVYADAPVPIYLKQKRSVNNMFEYLVESSGLDPTSIAGYKIPSKYKKYASVTKGGVVTAKKAGYFEVIAYDRNKQEIVTAAFETLKPSLKFDTVNSLSEEVNAYNCLQNWYNSVGKMPIRTENDWLTYKSSKTSVAQIDQYGNLTFVGKGTTTISVTIHGKKIAEGGDYSTDITLKGTLKVKIPTLNKSLVALKPGKSATIKLKGVGADKTVIWPSSNESLTYEPYGKSNESCKITANPDRTNGYTGYMCCSINGDRFYFGTCVIATKNVTYTVTKADGTPVEITGKFDTKKAMQFTCAVNKRRLSLGLTPIGGQADMTESVYARVKEMPISPGLAERPDGSDINDMFTGGYTYLFHLEILKPGKASSVLSGLRKKYAGAASGFDSADTRYLSVAVFKTKSTYKVNGHKTKEFMVVACGQ